jgi:hypothetical protein
MGSPVFVVVTCSTLPIVKRRQIAKANCIMALEAVEKTIEVGTRVRTFFTSSPTVVRANSESKFQVLYTHVEKSIGSYRTLVFKRSIHFGSFTGNWKRHCQQTQTPRHGWICPTTQIVR